MPLIALIIFGIASVALGADSPSLVQQYPMDVMKALWWALGILASFAVFVSCGTAVWMLKTVIQHDKDLVEIKTRCKIECEEE